MLALKPLKSRVISRFYRVLAIESSCDDSSVALMDFNEATGHTEVVSHLKSTLNSSSVGGVIPTEALSHHQMSLPSLIREIIGKKSEPIEFIAVTQGPGMVGSLSVGLNLAKGLSLGLSKRLLGVHHMLGHLLVPRMNQQDQLKFPIISLLASGGHTMLVESQDILTHKILVDTIDIAIGDSMDKCGRQLGIKANMIAKEMEKLALKTDNSKNLLHLPNPLSASHNKRKLSFSFSPFITALNNQIEAMTINDESTLNHLAFEIQESHFNHLIYKIKQYMVKHGDVNSKINFVASGGVSCNKRLRTKLETELREYFESFHYPSNNELCTDNAMMIGWAAIELYNHFKTTESCHISNNLDILPMRKWDLTELISKSQWFKTPF